LFLFKKNSNGFSVLASLNLPAAIEALEQPIGLPQGLLKRSEEVRKEGGAASLISQRETILQLASKDNEILSEVYIYFFPFPSLFI